MYNGLKKNKCHFLFLLAYFFVLRTANAAVSWMKGIRAVLQRSTRHNADSRQISFCFTAYKYFFSANIYYIYVRYNRSDGSLLKVKTICVYNNRAKRVVPEKKTIDNRNNILYIIYIFSFLIS